MAKGVFDDIGTPYLAVELNQRGDGREIQETLHKITGGTTVSKLSFFKMQIFKFILYVQMYVV